MKCRAALLAAATLIFACICMLHAQHTPKRRDILIDQSLWRHHYVLMPPVMRVEGKIEKIDLGVRKVRNEPDRPLGKWLDFPTPMPPTEWRQLDFNDSGWYRGYLLDPDSPWVGHQTVRGKFAVNDPAGADGLLLSVSYRGGVVVFLNGSEIARGHLKPEAPPDDIPF